jgi:protein-disulfide isomerase
MASVDQQGAVQYDDMVGYARDMGLDLAQFESCLAGGQHRATVTQSVQQAQQMGLSFTPSVIVNGTLLQDSSYPSVKLAIEAVLGAQ